jgi:hypothetical protein
MPLKVGDELRVGPLHFRVEELVKTSGDSKPASPAAAPQAVEPAAPAKPQDINRAKQPPAKDVAEVVERTVSKGEGASSEDDISRWLLGIDNSAGETLRETQTLSLEETTTISRAAPDAMPASANGKAPAEEAESEAEAPAGKDAGELADKAGSGGWNLFKSAKNRIAKKKPGKLPPRPADVSKDSREAAADILREMTRRR